ncbi:MAG: hypothetical protein HKO93_06245, partial [Flavobacteriales bacterium]|nr:hypothetical protein [Flavobacteriales bacterium]
FKALEHYSNINGMQLKVISGGSAFGIDYHLNVLLHPIPFKFGRRVIASMLRGFMKLKSRVAYLGLRYKRKLNKTEAKEKALKYYQLECLRQSNGFSYVIEKL